MSESTQTNTTNTESTAKQSGILITEKAAAEIKRLASKDNFQGIPTIRVQVVGGGCSGMSYKINFESKDPVSSDKSFEKDGVRLLIDFKSFLYLNGTELDFSDGLNGTGFVFNNPNAKRTCGCGSSFSV